MSGLRYDKEFAEAMPFVVNAPRPLKFNDIFEQRKVINGLLEQAKDAHEAPDDMELMTIRIKSYDGAEVELTRFTPPQAINSPTPLPAVLYVHGGGMVGGSVEVFKGSIAYHARQAGVPFFAVHMRLAPEYPAPTSIEDCFAALKYMMEHAFKLGIDATKITIAGFSAGGGIAASTALVARDRQLSPPLAKQILIYPMLDDRTVTPSDESEKGQFYVWPASWNILSWRAYLGGPERQAEVAKMHAAPARTEDLTGLPPTYLEIGSLDLFFSETVEHAKRLGESDVEVELHVWPGLPHAFDSALDTSWHKKAMSSRIEALTRF